MMYIVMRRENKQLLQSSHMVSNLAFHGNVVSDDDGP
jgi:hypothetical protein